MLLQTKQTNKNEQIKKQKTQTKKPDVDVVPPLEHDTVERRQKETAPVSVKALGHTKVLLRYWGATPNPPFSTQSVFMKGMFASTTPAIMV